MATTSLILLLAVALQVALFTVNVQSVPYFAVSRNNFGGWNRGSNLASVPQVSSLRPILDVSRWSNQDNLFKFDDVLWLSYSNTPDRDSILKDVQDIFSYLFAFYIDQSSLQTWFVKAEPLGGGFSVTYRISGVPQNGQQLPSDDDLRQLLHDAISVGVQEGSLQYLNLVENVSPSGSGTATIVRPILSVPKFNWATFHQRPVIDLGTSWNTGNRFTYKPAPVTNWGGSWNTGNRVTISARPVINLSSNNNWGIGNRWSNNNYNSFQLDDKLWFNYQNSNDRDDLLQQILEEFKYLFGQYLDSSSVQIRVISAVDAGAGGYWVKFRISGNANDQLPSRSDLIQGLHDAIQLAVKDGSLQDIDLNDSSIQGSLIQPVRRPWHPQHYHQGWGWSHQGGGRQQVSISNGWNQNQRLELVDSLWLDYRNNDERDALLQTLLDGFKSLFGSYFDSSLKIYLVSASPASGGGYNVYFKISGPAIQQLPSNSYLLQKFHDAISVGVQDGSLQSIDLPDQGGNSVRPVTFNRPNWHPILSLSTNYNTDNRVIVGGGQGSHFEFDSSLWIQYRSVSERDNILRQIQAKFISLFGSYIQDSSVDIYLLNAQPVGSNGYSVSYRLAGTATSQLPSNSQLIQQLNNAIQQAIQDGSLQNVNLIGPAKSFGSGRFFAAL